MCKMTSLMLALMLTTAMPQAYAATVDAKGAAALQKLVQDSLAFPVASAKNKMQGMTMGGNVEVTPKDGYYEVKIPDLAIVAPNTYKVKIGTIVANMSPGDDGSYATTLALPSPIEFDNGKGEKVGDITIGSQHFTGTWRPDLAILTDMDAEYKDVAITADGTLPFTINIKDIKNTMKLSKDGPDTWSGPVGFEVTGLTSNVKPQGEGTVDVALAHFVANYAADKMNLKARKDSQDKLVDMLNKSATDGAKPSPEAAGELANSMLSAASGFMNGMETSYTLENLDVKVTPAAPAAGSDKKPESPTHVTLARLTSTTKTTGMLADQGAAHATFGFSGLDVDNGPKDALSGAIPTQGNIDVALNNLPMKTLGATLSQGFSQAIQTTFDDSDMSSSPGDIAAHAALKQQAQMQMMTAMATIPQALASAGTNIEINDTHIDAPDLGTSVAGKITASMTSPLRAVGNLSVSFAGLDELLQKVQAIAQSPDSSPRLMAASQWLMMVQMMGQVEKAPDGKSMRVFKFELTPDGHALMNGKEMGAAMGAGATMMQAQQPPAPEQAPAPAPAPAPATP